MKREIDKFSKRKKKSVKASYSPIESINQKSDQQILIPITTQLIFPHQQVATLHLPTRQPNQNTSQLLWPAEIIMPSSLPKTPVLFLINASTPIPIPVEKPLVSTPS